MNIKLVSIFYIIYFISISSSVDVNYYNRLVESIIDDPFTIVCQLDNNTNGCSANGVCETIELCMNYLTKAINEDSNKNSTLVLIPDGFVTCPVSSYPLPASKLHVFYKNSSSNGFECKNQFINVDTNYPTDILFYGLRFNRAVTPLDGALAHLLYSPSSPSEIPSITFMNCEMNGQTAKGRGGSIFSEGYTVNMIHTSIISGFSSQGGAVYISNGDINLYNCIFLNCWAYSTSYLAFGGAIYISNGSAFIDKSIFRLNYAEVGGAIYAPTIRVNNTGFYNNKVDQYASAIYSTNSSMIYNSLFQGGYSNMGSGGVLLCDGQVCYIDNSTFINNYAKEDGGSIFSNVPTLIVENSIFNHSIGGQGGAIAAQYSVDISNTEFVNCNALFGGSIYLYETAETAFITQSYLYNNSAKYGGALFGKSVQTNYYFIDSIMDNNFATEIAGALFSLEGYPKIIGGRFYNNYNKNEKSCQTFNDDEFSSANIVNVSSAVIIDPEPYLVPIVMDSEGIRAYGVYGQHCINGYANIDHNGYIIDCICFNGWTGSSCDQQ